MRGGSLRPFKRMRIHFSRSSEQDISRQLSPSPEWVIIHTYTHYTQTNGLDKKDDMMS